MGILRLAAKRWFCSLSLASFIARLSTQSIDKQFIIINHSYWDIYIYEEKNTGIYPKTIKLISYVGISETYDINHYITWQRKEKHRESGFVYFISQERKKNTSCKRYYTTPSSNLLFGFFYLFNASFFCVLHKHEDK